MMTEKPIAFLGFYKFQGDPGSPCWMTYETRPPDLLKCTENRELLDMSCWTGFSYGLNV